MAETVRCPADLELDWSLRFLSARAIPSVESAGPDHIRRVHAGALVEARFETRRGRVHATVAGGNGAVAWLTHLLDLDTDLGPFRAMAATDTVLRPLVARRPGLRLPRLADPFETLVRAVVGQVVSVAVATTLLGRLAETFGEPAGDGWRSFPSAARLAGATPASIASIGLTRAKAAAISEAARAILRGDLDWDSLRTADRDVADRTLRALPGIGPWTSSYIRLRAFGDSDAFPSTDLGIVIALKRFGVPGRSIGRRTDQWRPWRGLAVAHLWASLGD